MSSSFPMASKPLNGFVFGPREESIYKLYVLFI